MKKRIMRRIIMRENSSKYKFKEGTMKERKSVPSLFSLSAIFPRYTFHV